MIETNTRLNSQIPFTDAPSEVLFGKETELMDERNVLVRTRTIAAVLVRVATERRSGRVEGLSLAYIAIRLEISSQEDAVVHVSALLEEGGGELGEGIHFAAINLIMTDVRAWQEHRIMLGILASEVGNLITLGIEDVLAFEIA